MSEVIGNPKQIADLDRINRTAEQLSDLLSRYYADHGTMLDIGQIKLITNQMTITEVSVTNANPDYAQDSPQ